MDSTEGAMGTVEEEIPRGQMRAADTDREHVAEQLRTAHADGRLDLTEYDERIQQAWAARTYGELEALTADLPQPHPPGVQETRSDDVWQHSRRCGRLHSGHASVSAWAGASLINLLIWAIVCLSTMSWIYPWWIWVAGPWGAMLLARRIGERASVARLGGD
jgi:hypothetical protein